MTDGWKITAIILLIILLSENAFIVWGYTLVQQDEENTMECYYDVCEQYEDAYFDVDTSLCTCYEYDMLGEPIVAKTKYFK